MRLMKCSYCGFEGGYEHIDFSMCVARLRGELDLACTAKEALKQSVRDLLEMIESEEVRAACLLAALHGQQVSSEKALAGKKVIQSAKALLLTDLR